MAGFLFKWLMPCMMLFYNGSGAPTAGTEAFNRHPMYVTVTEISHNEKDKSLEISCKIFTNDFEDVLEKTFATKVDLGAPAGKAAADKLVSAYITKHLQLKVDGKPVVLQFVGSEKETDALWSYFQVAGVQQVKKLEVMNNLLYESYSNEINIMHVSVGGNRKSGKLNNPDNVANFEF